MLFVFSGLTTTVVHRECSIDQRHYNFQTFFFLATKVPDYIPFLLYCLLRLCSAANPSHLKHLHCAKKWVLFSLFPITIFDSANRSDKNISEHLAIVLTDDLASPSTESKSVLGILTVKGNFLAKTILLTFF